MNKASDFVYLFECGGVYKIGIATNVKRRHAEIQAVCPQSLNITCSFPHDDAEACESALHEKYSHLHMHREWFALTPVDVAEIVALADQQAREYGRFFAGNDFASVSLRMSPSMRDIVMTEAIRNHRSMHNQILMYITDCTEGKTADLDLLARTKRPGRKPKPVAQEETDAKTDV